MLTLLHGSDLHFGKPHDPRAAEHFATLVGETEPDVLVLSGDFTQRAKVREFAEAREYIAGFAPIPVVVTPGNHDVPLYRVFERLFQPHRNYREYLSHELDTVTRIDGASIVALDSSAPRRKIVNGHISRAQLAFARQAFRDSPPGGFRVLVTHHHIAPAPDYEVDYPLPGGRRILAELTAMGVDLILSGHLHRAYIADARDVAPEVGRSDADGALIIHSGTTTSTRGRARERARNSCNVIRVGTEAIEVTEMILDRERGFRRRSVHRFPRRPHNALPEGD